MCRICGRMVICIFDSMPSRVRIHHVPSRRAFTTVRRLPTTSLPSTSPAQTLPRPLSLTRAFSNLSFTSTSILSTLPSSSASTHRSPFQSLSSPRLFSSTPAALGHRRRMDTYSPSRRVQKRRHGYLARMRTKAGQEVIKRRRLKKRSNVSW